MTVFTTYQGSLTGGPDSQFHGNEVNESLSSGAVKNTMKNQKISRMKDVRGFTLIEILMVAGMIAVVGAFSMMILGPALEARNVDMAARTVSTQMSRARQFSVDARRRTRVTFTAPTTITVDEQAPVSQGGAWSQVSTTQLPGEMELDIDAAITSGPEGHATSQAADFSGASEVFFMPDGSAVTSAGLLSNGVVYVSEPAKWKSSTRAVTLFGSTGRIKRYTYSTGAGWE
ncbi:MAG: Tfp pilus assembly protein FimT/FimU [Candidatus Binatia bacterium]